MFSVLLLKTLGECLLFLFEAGLNAPADETVQLLLGLSDPSGRTMHTASMLLYFERN